MNAAKDTTAVIVDRHPLWLDAFETLLDGLGIEVVGRTASADEALDLVEAHRPTMLVMEYEAIESDTQLSSLLHRTRELRPDAKCMVLAADSDEAKLEVAFAAGASAFCVKATRSDDLAFAVRQMFDRSVHFSAAHAAAAARRAPCRPQMRETRRD